LYRAHCVKQGNATAYVTKLITIARTFFGVAHRRKLIDENPFRYVEAGSYVNRKRDYYKVIKLHFVNLVKNSKMERNYFLKLFTNFGDSEGKDAGGDGGVGFVGKSYFV